MTPRDKLVVYKMSNPTDGLPEPEFFRDLMHKNRVEKIPIVYENTIFALITLKVNNRISTKY